MKKIIITFAMIVIMIVGSMAHMEIAVDMNAVDLREGGVVLDGEDVTVTLDAGYEVNQYGNHGEPWNYIDAFGVIENNRDEKITLVGGDIAINGWQTDCAINDMNWMGSDVEPHRKLKVRFTFDLYNANVKEVSEIEDFTVTFKVKTMTWDTIYESEPVRLIP